MFAPLQKSEGNIMSSLTTIFQIPKVAIGQSPTFAAHFL
jgi:hypothetical protein